MPPPATGQHRASTSRDLQNLPVPIGGFAPAHAAPRRRRWRPALPPSGLGLVLAVAAAATGVALTATRPVPAAYLRGDRLVVGAMVLRAEGADGASRLFGGDASYVLGERSRDGTEVASAAWGSDGAAGSGRCVMHSDGARLVDECSFSVGSTALTSVDLLDPATGTRWQRTYADGVQATIDVPDVSSAVPVPFPIGH